MKIFRKNPRYTPRLIAAVERIRKRELESSDENYEEENKALLESLPKLPSHPKGNSKRVVIIQKRTKSK